MTFRHILLATDLSEVSEGALGAATALARASAARLTILYVYAVSASTAHSEGEEVAEQTWPGAICVRKRLDLLIAGLRAVGLRAEGVIRFGQAAERIAEAAEELQVDLVVTGTHGRKGLARFWYGSVAAGVRRHSNVPLLAVQTEGNVIALRAPRATNGNRPSPRARRVASVSLHAPRRARHL